MSTPKKVQPVYLGVVVPLCHYCKHQDQDVPSRCEAYPDMIPQEVLWMNVDHRAPYLGDHGIRFELREDMDPWWYEMFLKEQVSSERPDECRRYEMKVEEILGAEAEQVIETASKAREVNSSRSVGVRKISGT